MSVAGMLRHRLHFNRRALDANGRRNGPWERQFTLQVDIDYLRGTQSAVEQRLQGIQPVTITLRDSSVSRLIATNWQAVNAHDETEVFDVTASSPAKRRGWRNLLATSQQVQR